METYIIFIKLLCAHLFTDFILQPRDIKTATQVHVLTHSAIHAAVAYIVVADWSCWIIPLTIFLTHLIIDSVARKLVVRSSITSFLTTQGLNIAAIGLLWFVLYGKSADAFCWNALCSANVWAVLAAYILMLRPSSIFLSLLLSKWAPASLNTQSLPNAGKWIGYIERTLILTFILVGSLECVGFLLTAKSVFRFGELNKAKEIRTTEYVLIGTLASFAIAILIGIAVVSLLG